MNTAIQKLMVEWQAFLCAFFRAPVIIPVLLVVLSLYFANGENVNRNFSILLQIIAVVFSAIGIGYMYDVVRNILREDILRKKGLSAIRNLALSRSKTKNIFLRTEGDAQYDEIKNLLSLLEKDIANAVQEWEDVYPGISKTAEIYNVLSEKEGELEKARKEKDILCKQLTDEKELNEKEKESLNKELSKKEKRISELSIEMTQLRMEKTGALTLDQIGPSTLTSLSSLTLEKLGRVTRGLFKSCEFCGKPYTSQSSLDLGVCDECTKIK